MQAEVDASCGPMPGFMAGVTARVLFYTILGYSLMNTAYWGEMSRRIFTSRLADLVNCVLGG